MMFRVRTGDASIDYSKP